MPNRQQYTQAHLENSCYTSLSVLKSNAVWYYMISRYCYYYKMHITKKLLIIFVKMNTVSSCVLLTLILTVQCKPGVLVDKICYLGDMLSVNRDADAAVETRIRVRWNKFRQLLPLLTNKGISLIVRGRLYNSCVQSSILYGSETWPMKKKMRWHFSGQRWEWLDGCVALSY